METALYVDKNCRLCHGKGRVATGKFLGEEAICACVLLGKRRVDAERIIKMKLPARAASMTLAGYDTGGDPKNEQALAIARNFIDNYEQAEREGWVLGFWGLPGSGKTHLTIGIAQECVRRWMARPYVFNVSAELRHERERFGRNRDLGDIPVSPIDQAVNAELLILDDLGAEYHRQGAESDQVSWVYEQLYTILEERIMACRPTLFSSNLSPNDLARRMGTESGKRVLSRIERAQVTPALEVIEVPGANRQSEEAVSRLFAERKPKEFELHNQLNGRRKRYDKEALAAAINAFCVRRGAAETLAQLSVTRIERDGQSVQEAADVSEFLAADVAVV